MSDALKCTSCRSAIDVPADHAGETIRCGICWTEVAVPKVAVLTPAAQSGSIPTAKALPAPAGSGATKLSGVQVAALLPIGAKPAAGMARLEALIHKAGVHLRPSAVVKMPPVATRLPSTGSTGEIAVAELLPTVPTVAPAVPAAAPVLRPAPVGKLKSDDEPRKPRYRTRGSRDDDDDDRPHRRSTRGGALVFALTGAAVLVLVLGFCGYLLVREFASPSSEDMADDRPGVPVNNAAPPANVNPNPLPPFRVPDPGPEPNNPPVNPNNPPGFVPPRFEPPRAERPPVELVWKPVAGDGFAAELPGDARQDGHWLHVHGTGTAARAGFVKADGKKWTTNDRGYTFEISYVDLPAAFEPDLKRVLTPFNQQAVKPARFAGRDGLELVEPRVHMTEEKRLVQVDRRVYVFRAHTHPIFGRDAKHAEDARKKFFDSVKLTGEGGAAGGEPEDPAGRPNDVAPGPAVAAAHRVPPFTTAVVLPQRGEVLFFGTRTHQGRLSGELRRFTYPAFLPKNTYYLPYPVTFAAADEKAGKLAVTTVTRTDALWRDGERNVTVGDVQVFDLKPILDGTVAERNELKPTATVPFGSRLAGLELADGKAVVLSLTAQTLNKAKPWKPKLTQVDLAAGRAVQDMELPDTMCRIKASADGKRVYAAEAPLSPAGAPIFMLPRNGYIMVVDVKEWKREKTFPVPGTACDLAVTPDGVVVASVTLNRDFKLYAFPEAGNAIDLNPAGKAASLGYVALTADGRKLVTAASVAAGATGVAVLDVSNLDGPGGLKTVAEARVVKLPNAAADAQAPPIGGNFFLTPDGKFALFQMGVVLELAKLAN